MINAAREQWFCLRVTEYFKVDDLRNHEARLTCARHERLKAWVACHELVLSVYRASSGWPSAERYGLISQARRAAYSTAANIAEGSAKRDPREFRRFLDISLGSIAELTYVLRLARDLGYLKLEDWGEIEAMRDHAGRLTWGLYRTVAGKPG
jgi:four helix bundle protein